MNFPLKKIAKSLEPCNCPSGKLENLQHAAKLIKRWPKSNVYDNGRWFVAVTTASRKSSTLSTCLESIRANGWLPAVYAEPESDTKGIGDCILYSNQETLGPWFNWLQAATRSLDTGAEYILLMQDDIQLVPGIRHYLERTKFPSHMGFLSLYLSSRQDQNKTPGVVKVTKSFDKGSWQPASIFWGACAWVFHRDALKRLLDRPNVKEWRGLRPYCIPNFGECVACKKPISSMGKAPSRRCQVLYDKRENREVRNIDTIVSQELQKMGLHWYAIAPSASQHIAKHSTIWDNATNEGSRAANRVVSSWAAFHPAKPSSTGDALYDRAIDEWRELMGNSSFVFPKGLWDQLRDLVPDRAVLEFGSGVSTWLMQHVGAEVTSYEQDGYVASLTGATHSPLSKSTGWYSRKPKGKFDILLVDGPARRGREGVLPHLKEWLNPGGLLFVDDTHRLAEMELANAAHKVLQGQIMTFGEPNRKWSVLSYPDS